MTHPTCKAAPLGFQPSAQLKKEWANVVKPQKLFESTKSEVVVKPVRISPIETKETKQVDTFDDRTVDVHRLYFPRYTTLL